MTLKIWAGLKRSFLYTPKFEMKQKKEEIKSDNHNVIYAQT